MISARDYPFLQFVRDLAHYIAPYKKQFFAGAFLRLTSDIVALYPAWAVSQIVAILAAPSVQTMPINLLRILIILGIVSVYHGFFHSYSKILGYQVSEKAALDLYRDGLAHLFKLDFAWQEKENSGNKMKRIDKGLDGVNTTIRRIFDVLIEVVVNVIGIVAIFFTLDRNLSISIILFVVVYFIIGTLLLKRAVKQERIVNKSYENLGGLTFESLNNIQTIKSLAIDRGVVRMVSDYISSLMRKVKKRIFLFQSRNMILSTYEAMYGFAVITFLVFGIINGQIQLSLLVLFIGLFGRVSTSARELTDVTQQLALAKIWVSRAMTILQTEPKIENPQIIPDQFEYPEGWKKVKIDGIKFAYKKEVTLKNVTFEVRRNEKVGVVGLSGAGKSTLFKLLLDLYESYDGDILIGDVPLKKIKRQSFIDHVAVVLQDTELFDMSLRDNIEIGSVKRQEQGLLDEVIRMARLEEVVAKLPKGVDTIVGEKGIRLSGGQKQRVGIARALYRRPDILLLDEATSHLDAHSEREIQKAILESVGRFTAIVIAHRLSTIKAMDKIVVLHEGEVAEQGTFTQLLNKGGVFAKMWQEQKI